MYTTVLLLRSSARDDIRELHSQEASCPAFQLVLGVRFSTLTAALSSQLYICADRFCGEKKVLEERDLEPVMTKMREQLMGRNVASEVANDITASVQATLIDQKLKSFTRCAPQDMVLLLDYT